MEWKLNTHYAASTVYQLVVGQLEHLQRKPAVSVERNGQASLLKKVFQTLPFLCLN